VFAKYIDSAIRGSIYETQRESQLRTPVDTGRLRQSYETAFTPLKGVLEPKTDYAYWVHEGTRRMRARPFLAQGLEESDPQIQAYFEKAVENGLSEIANNSK
jgi:hypothetical protein